MIAFGAILICIVIVFLFFLSEKNRIIQVADVITVEAGQELVLKGSDFFDTKEENYEKIVFNIENVDVNTVGLYEVEASFGKRTFKIKVNVQDTKAPVITFAKRYMFTCDIKNTDKISTMLESVYEVSEFTMRFIRFEKKENLRELNAEVLETLTKDIDILGDTEQLCTFGTEQVPEEEGIYQAVLEVIDIHGNATYEDVVLVLDKTGAYIEDVPDKVIEVNREALSKQPEIDAEDYIIIDNVDGKIAAESVNFEVELIDEEKHEWIVYVCYIDRAGNESRGDFLVIVKENDRKIEDKTDRKNESSNKNNVDDTEGNLEVKQPDNSKNQNENEWIPTDNENDISPWEQKVIDAGYGNVVDFGDGAYGVLTHNDGYAGGKRGGEILREYLLHYGLEPQNVSGGIIDEENDWRWYIADNIRKMDNAENDW